MIDIIVIFLLGIVNFALHSAVLRSGHSLLDELSGLIQAMGGRFTLLLEFAVLLTALLLAANGWPSVVWIYAGFSVLNGISAWMILTGRI